MAIKDADVILLVVDATVGVTEEDARVANLLRRSGKLDEAAKQLEAAVKSAPPPSDGELAEVKVPLFLEQKIAAIEAYQHTPPSTGGTP